jgi:electron transfer flavoprotein alpha subunit
MQRPIIVIARTNNKQLAPVTRELISGAREIAMHRTSPICLIMAGDELKELAKTTAGETGLDVIWFRGDFPADNPAAFWMNLAPRPILGLNPSCICMAGDAAGAEIAPALAIRLKAGCITGVEKISVSDGALCFTRKIFNGKIAATFAPDNDLTVVTIVPGAFAPDPLSPHHPEHIPTPQERKPGRIMEMPTARHLHAAQPVQFLGYKSDTAESAGLNEAEVIVAAGNGIGKKENLALVHELAGLFAKSAVAGSRPVCDKKWLPLNRQVGVTGATVSPKLYIACGISGAEQHIAGMKTSDLIVSINTDPHAAIFGASDICVIEDLTTFIPLFIDICRNQ